MKKDLKKILKCDKENIISGTLTKKIFYYLTNHINKINYISIVYFRKYYYYKEKKKYLLCVYYAIKKNKIIEKYNIELPKRFGKNLRMPHRNVIINENAVVGDNCCFHGFNVVGNNGKNEKAPRLGNNVDVGVGAKIIGDIYIADNCIIAANAVVNKSCYEKGTILIGVPAKSFNKK